MDFQFVPYSVLAVISAGIALFLAFVIWQRRPGQGVYPFVILMLALALWCVMNFGEQNSRTLVGKLTFLRFAYIGILTIPAAWFVFIKAYIGQDKWLTRQRLLLLSIEPLIVWVLILTSASNDLYWSRFDLALMDNYVVTDTDTGVLFWVHAAYTYILLLVSAIILFRAFLRSPELFKGQMTFLLIGSFAPWIANALYITGNSPLPESVDLTPIAFTITGLSVGWSLYRFRLLDIVLVARESIIEKMNDAVFVLNEGGYILDANRATLRLLNKAANDVIGQPAESVLQNQKGLVDQYRRAEIAQDEITLPIGDELHYFDMAISPLYNQHYQVMGRIVSLHDITPLKQLNQQLEAAREAASQLAKQKAEFLATMSHELRSPLNAIIGYSEIMVEELSEPLSPKTHKMVKRVHENGKQLLDLINDILDLSKLESGYFQVDAKAFACIDLADDVLSQMNVLAEKKGLKLELKIAEDFPETIIGDAGRIKQILINLISNAIKFTEQGKVSLNVLRENQTMVFEVCDTGKGIPAESLDKIFEEFSQVDSSSEHRHESTGLGLSIVKKLLTAMQGSISVESVLGEGSTFRVRLPLATQLAESA